MMLDVPRKMSPTAMCSRSKSAASIFAWVPLPLPWMPMMTYFRIPATFARKQAAGSWPHGYAAARVYHDRGAGPGIAPGWPRVWAG